MQVTHRSDNDLDRIVFDITGDRFDGTPPFDSVFVHPGLNPVHADCATVGLYLVLRPFCADEFSTDLPCSPHVARTIERESGHRRRVTSIAKNDFAVHSGELDYVITGSAFEHMLATMFVAPKAIPVFVGAGLAPLGAFSTSFSLTSNICLLGRKVDPASRIGELATLLVAAPTLSVKNVTVLFTKEQFGRTPVASVIDLLRGVGIFLSAPFAELSYEDHLAYLKELGCGWRIAASQIMGDSTLNHHQVASRMSHVRRVWRDAAA